jgi:hypothetical protein
VNAVSQWSYFGADQSTSQAAKSKKEVRQLRESQYRLNSELAVVPNTVDDTTLRDNWYGQADSMRLEEPGSEASRPHTTRTSQRAQPCTLDALDRSLLEPAEIPGKLSNGIAYWQAKNGSYPLLCPMSLDFLLILPRLM